VSLLGLVERMNRARFEPYVVCPEEGDFLEALLERGVPALVRRMPSLRGWSGLTAPLALRPWIQLIHRYGIQLLHADGTRAMIHAGLAGRLASVPVLWHVRVLGSDGLLDRMLARISTRVLVNSDAVARRFDFMKARSSSDGPTVIPNGVELESFARATRDPVLRRQWGLEGKFALLMLAQLIPWKRQDLAIQILSLLRKRGLNASLVLVGEEVASSRGERARLEEVRSTGVAINVDEFVAGASGIAAPIFDRAGAVVAACTVIGPTGRLLTQQDDLARWVKAAGDAVSRRLGFQPG